MICESRRIEFHWQWRSGKQQPSFHDSSQHNQATLFFCFAASSIENYCSFTSKPTPKPTQKSFCVFTLVWSQSRFPHRDQRMFPQVKKWLVLLWCGEHSVPQRRFILYHTHISWFKESGFENTTNCNSFKSIQYYFNINKL